MFVNMYLECAFETRAWCFSPKVYHSTSLAAPCIRHCYKLPCNSGFTGNPGFCFRKLWAHSYWRFVIDRSHFQVSVAHSKTFD